MNAFIQVPKGKNNPLAKAGLGLQEMVILSEIHSLLYGSKATGVCKMSYPYIAHSLIYCSPATAKRIMNKLCKDKWIIKKVSKRTKKDKQKNDTNEYDLTVKAQLLFSEVKTTLPSKVKTTHNKNKITKQDAPLSALAEKFKQGVQQMKKENDTKTLQTKS